MSLDSVKKKLAIMQLNIHAGVKLEDILEISSFAKNLT